MIIWLHFKYGSRAFLFTTLCFHIPFHIISLLVLFLCLNPNIIPHIFIFIFSSTPTLCANHSPCCSLATHLTTFLLTLISCYPTSCLTWCFSSSFLLRGLQHIISSPSLPFLRFFQNHGSGFVLHECFDPKDQKRNGASIYILLSCWFRKTPVSKDAFFKNMSSWKLLSQQLVLRGGSQDIWEASIVPTDRMAPISRNIILRLTHTMCCYPTSFRVSREQHFMLRNANNPVEAMGLLPVRMRMWILLRAAARARWAPRPWLPG